MKSLRKSWVNAVCSVLMLTVLMLTGLLLVRPVRALAASNITLSVKSGADIAEELQDALDIARDDKSGVKITIPAGSYKIGRILKVYSNTTLSMQNVTIVRSSDCKDSMLRFGRSDEGGFSGYSGFSNIVFDGGTWDSNYMDGKSIMRFAHAQNVTFKNVTFKNVRSNHHVELAACKKVTFTGCTFANFKGNLTGNTNYEALQMDIMHMEAHFSNYGKYDDTPCTGITVTGCKFKNLQRGVGSHSAVAGSYFTNMKIQNNLFQNISGYAVICTNYRNAVISGNTVKDCGAGIFFRTMVQNYSTFYKPLKGKAKIVKNAASVIEGNTIEINKKGYPNVAFGVSLYGENVKKAVKDVPKGNYILQGVTVKGNKITMNATGYGIWLQGCEKSRIQQNKITCNIRAANKSGKNGDGIRIVGSSSNRLEKNTITNKKSSGAGKSVCGISVLDGSNKTIVKGNTITGASIDGIAVKKSKSVTVQSNNITKSKRYGLNVTDSSTVTMKSNTVKKSGTKKDIVCTRGAKVNGKTTLK